MNQQLIKILSRGFLLILPFFAYYIGYESYCIYTRNFYNDGKCMYTAMDKSYRTVAKKKIIFGESLGLQLYPLDKDVNQDYYTLTTTWPSSIVGVYILLQNFIAHNKTEGDTFYYIIRPNGFVGTLETKWTYTHFLKPFYKPKYLKYITPAADKDIRKIPYWYAAQAPFIKISDWQPEYSPKVDTSQPIPVIPLQYLQMIDSLSKQYHFKFYLISPFLNVNDQNEQYVALKNCIRQNGLDDIFSRYFQSMKYLPPQDFEPVAGHYRNPEKYGLNPLGI